MDFSWSFLDDDGIRRAGGRPFSVFSLDGHSRFDDTTLASRRGVTGVAFTGARAFLFLEGSEVLPSYDQGFDSSLWAWRSAFQLIDGLQVEPAPNLQLLPQAAAAGFGPREKHLRSNSRRGARP